MHYLYILWETSNTASNQGTIHWEDNTSVHCLQEEEEDLKRTCVGHNMYLPLTQ